MSLVASEMTPADIAAVSGNNNGGGWGMNDGSWLIILFLFAILGWGNGGFGNGGGSNGGAGGLFPWINQTDTVNSGFRDQMLNDNITSIRDGVYGLSNQLCNCCGDVQMSLANGFAGVEQGANARQIANMQTAFAGQTAMAQGFNSLQAQLADCCCENRLATCQTQNIVQNESAATRFADANNTRDIIDSQTRGTQAILDKLCALELDAKNDTIAQLRQELLYSKAQASQDVQTAVLRQGQEAEVDALYNRLSNCPVPSMPVYGRTPIFTCGQNTGCGCGCNG